MKKIIFLTLIFFSCFSKSEAQSFNGKPQYQILTRRAGVFLGNINVELFPNIAPEHTRNFDSLVNIHFYDSTAFHRVIPNFMIQGGDPNSRHGAKSTWGYGDPNQQTVNAEFSAAYHLRGILSAARDADTNSANSQFFICVATDAWLNGLYSIYGRVTSGMNIVDTIVNSPRDTNDNPIDKIDMFVTYIGDNDTVPQNPVLTYPLNGATGVGSSIQLRWNAQSDGIIYRVEVATDSLFTSSYLTKDAGTNNIVLSSVPDSTTYYWRVKTNNGGFFSNYSSVWHFSTKGAPLGIDDVSLQSAGYVLHQNIPNPVHDQTRIYFSIPQKEKVMLKLFDINGRELAMLLEEDKNKGDYEILLDMKNYAAGIYYYRLQAGEFSESMKLVLEK